MEKSKDSSLFILNLSSIDDKAKFDLNNFILQQHLGSGAFGKVYKIKDSSTGEIFAAKISKQTLDEISNEMIQDLEQEVNIISKLNHPSVLKFIGYSPINFKKKPKPVIVTEYAPCGSLEDLIKNDINKDLNDTLKLIIIYGIASGMSYLHLNNIIHRDLKPANILIDEFKLPKIADFGLSTIKQEIDPKSSNEIKGTPMYISPEIWEKSEYTEACDVYAFGIILYQILTNEKPFENCHLYEIMIKVKKGHRPEFKKDIPKSYRSLIESCWAQEPINRPSFDEILTKLKNDESFITDSIDKQEFLNYVNYIDNYQTTFNSDQKIIKLRKNETKINDKNDFYVLENEQRIKIIENPSCSDFGLFTFKEFIELDEESKSLVLEAEEDHSKYFKIAKSLIEGLDYFPFNSQVGIKYLKKSIKEGNDEALVYYCRLLIKGNVIPCNLEKAKKIIRNKLNNQDESFILFLIGKIKKKEKKFDEAKEFFLKSIELGNNNEAMLEYGNMICKGIGSEPDVNGIEYYEKATINGNLKACYYLGVLCKEGIYKTSNEKKYIEFIEHAVDFGYPEAFLFYSKMIEEGVDVPFDVDKSFYCKRLSAFLGSIEGMYQYALHCFRFKHKPVSLNEAKRFFKKASDKGHVEAMFKYALSLLESDVKSERKKGVKFMKYAAISGNVNAMFNYGFNLLKGIEVPIDEEEGMFFVKEAADKGNTFAMSIYAISLKNLNNKNTENKDEVKKYLKMAADKGDPNGLELYGKFLLNNNYDKDPSINLEAVDCIKKASFAGNIDAISTYSNILLNGIGVPPDKSRAILFYNLGINKGSTKCMHSYGFLLLEGTKVPMNREEGVRLIKMAADKGYAKSMHEYGIMLTRGSFVSINLEEGARYIKMAADKNYLPAISDYSYMLAHGIGVPTNKELAIRYIKIAINKKSPTAMRIYGTMLEEGLGVPVNSKEAIKYYKMALDNGDKAAIICYARMLYKGEGIPADKGKAIEYFKTAINDLNSVDAMFNLGYILTKEEGNDDPEKKKEGLIYIKKAADLGYLNAIKLYKELLENDKEKANFFKEESEKGDIISMYNYGGMLLNGEGVEVDKKKAFSYFKMAADKGHLDSICNVGTMLIQGTGIEANVEEGEKYLKIAIEKGHKKATFNYGAMLFKGQILQQNKEEGLKLMKLSVEEDPINMRIYAHFILEENEIEEAKKYLKMSADKNCVDAMNEYACLLLNNNNNKTEADIEEALEYLTKAANNKHIQSILNLCSFYESGNTVKFMKYLKIAADLGDVESIFKYGSYMFSGKDEIPPNQEIGLKYLKMAADNGHAIAMNNYGFCMENGIGTPVDIDEACRYYKLAIEKGSIDAMYSYGYMLLVGELIPRNTDDGVKYIMKAAEQGHDFSLYYCGQIYEKGISVEVDKEKAIQYYKLAAAKGVDRANNAILRLLKETK